MVPFDAWFFLTKKADAPILDDDNIVPVLVSAAFLKVNFIMMIISI